MDAPNTPEAVIPTGKLRPGLHKVAAVVSEDVFRAILDVQERRGLPSIHAATGVILREWFESLSRRVQNPSSDPGKADAPVAGRRVQNQLNEPEEACG